MVRFEVEFRDLDKGTNWEEYRSRRLPPFINKEDAEEFVKSGQVYVTLHSLPWVFRIVEKPL